MSGKLYVKNHLPVILLNLLGALALSLFLLATGNAIQTVLFILIIWILVLILCLSLCYLSRKKRLSKLLDMAEQLKEKYLIPEVMPEPNRAEEQAFYQLLKMAEKSMLERISEVERERGEYHAYIEQWVHEVKTPITALKLLCENNRSPFSRDVLVELEEKQRQIDEQKEQLNEKLEMLCEKQRQINDQKKQLLEKDQEIRMLKEALARRQSGV